MTITQPWAKIEQDRAGKVVRSHHLRAHSIDVASVINRLLEDRTIRRSLAAAGGVEDLSRVQCARLSVIGGGHDVGKLNTGFFCRAEPADWRGKPAPASHVEEATALFQGRYAKDFVDAMGGNAVINGWVTGGGTGFGNLLLAALSHHGTPIDLPGGQQLGRMERLWDDHTTPDGRTLTPIAWLRDLYAGLRDAFPEAWVDGGPALPATPRFQDQFAGLVAAADFVASTEDAEGEEGFVWDADGRARAAWARETADRLCGRIGLTSTLGRSLDANRLDIDRVVDAKANALQQLAAKLPVDGDDSLIALIESMTGTGKSEALIIHFLRMYAAGRVNGLYLALPTRTSAVQMHARVHAMLTRLLGPAAPPVVLAVPGYLRVDDLSARPRPNHGTEWDNPPGARGWAATSPARFMAAPIVIGTVDQAFMSVIAANHASLRASLLSRMMLAIDEVHASDDYMTRIATELVARTRAIGGHVTLMSATCGGELATRFLGTKAPTLKQAERRPYPAITWRAGPATPVTRKVPWRRRRTIKVDSQAIMEYPIEIARQAFDAARKDAKVLVIVNTVDRAMEIQGHLEEMAAQAGRPELLFRINGQACPHHSRFAAEDRRQLDKQATDALGRGRPGGGMVLVATQTMEQSIDVDADFLISDLCPMDVLLQRLGRLHRHDGAIRPKGYRRPRCIVAIPAGDLSRFINHPNHGLGTAYINIRVVEATRRALAARSQIRLPQEARALVEQTTHSGALDQMVQSLGGPWLFASSKMDAAILKQTNQAGLALRDIDHDYDDPSKPRTPLDPALVKTRFNDPEEGEDRAIRFWPRPKGPFGQQVSRITIPKWMAKGVGATDKPHILRRLTGGGFEFQCGFQDAERKRAAFFRYDRHGLRLLET